MRCIFFFALFLLQWPAAWCQPRNAVEYGASQGYPPFPCNDILQDQHGSMWFAVAYEVLCYGKLPVTTMQVTVYDANGRTVVNKSLPYQGQWLSLPGLSSGTYRMLIRSGAHLWTGGFMKP